MPEDKQPQSKPMGETQAKSVGEPKSKPAGNAKATPAAKPKAKAKKPQLEDKPFAEFIQQDYLPALETAFAAENIQDLSLNFGDNQVTGQWLEGQRQFTVYFPQASIQKQRAFSWAINGGQPSTIEPFLVDERKITLDLLVFGVIQRLIAQKWFGNN